MRAVADWLSTIDEHLVDIYSTRTGATAAQVETWLDGDDDGTLFSAKAAFENGFADEIIPLNRGKEHKKRAKTAEKRQEQNALKANVREIRNKAAAIKV